MNDATAVRQANCRWEQAGEVLTVRQASHAAEAWRDSAHHQDSELAHDVVSRASRDTNTGNYDH